MIKVEVLLLGFGSLVLTSALAIAQNPEIGGHLENIILKENWKEAIETLQRDNKKAHDPVARLVMAHACLATNRNNESMLLFLSVKDRDGLRLWSEWTESLLKEHSQNPSALYLSADAKLRSGAIEAAKEGFSQALQAKEDFALAYNARGVLHVLTDEWDKALIDFYQATKLAPDFADAHANLGTYWVLKEAPEGAIEAFNKALAINKDFALAYNGRGCAYFGSGSYEAAIADMEKAFELCPVLLPALSNEGTALAALTSRLNPKRIDSRPGTTFFAKSTIEQTDYTSLSSADEMTRFHQSIEELGRKDPLSAVRVCSIQLAKINLRIDDLSNKIQQRQLTIAAADKAKKRLQAFDQTLSLLDIRNVMTSIQPMPNSGWQMFTDLSRQTLQTVADFSTENTGTAYYSGLGSRALSHYPLISILRSSAYTFEIGAGTISDFAESHIGIYSGELAVRTRQYHNLRQQQQRFLSGVIDRKLDFSKIDMLGDNLTRLPTITKGPIPEYSIPRQSPLTQFGVLPSAIGKNIEPAQKPSLVVIAGETDVCRLGTMLRGFEQLGVQTLPVPSNMDAQSFGRMVGANQVLKITQEGNSESMLQKISSAQKPGGVTQDMSHAHIDLGDWPVMTSFSLCYGPGFIADETSQEDKQR